VGLLKPSRSEGNTRLYTDADLERLEVILTLTREMGVNLAGIEIILNMREKMAEMRRNAAPDGGIHILRAARIVPRTAIRKRSAADGCAGACAAAESDSRA
jgi:DNA-binding transcriptional MerR regulator